MTTTLSSYHLISTRMDAYLKSTSSDARTAADIKTYLARIPNIKSVDAFLKDDRVFRFAMKAYGLEDMVYAKAFMRRALTEGIDSTSTFANKLSDKRYRQFVATFNFKRYGSTATSFDAARQGTVDKYLRQTLEENSGQQNTSVRLALYFQRVAPTITSPYQILADKALTQVVYTALGMPATTSASDIDAQARLIESHIDFSDFRSPARLDKFIARFAARADIASGPTGVEPGLSLLSGSRGIGIGTDLLLALQSARITSTRS